VVFIIIF
jgi:hypothetical protein